MVGSSSLAVYHFFLSDGAAVGSDTNAISTGFGQYVAISTDNTTYSTARWTANRDDDWEEQPIAGDYITNNYFSTPSGQNQYYIINETSQLGNSQVGILSAFVAGADRTNPNRMFIEGLVTDTSPLMFTMDITTILKISLFWLAYQLRLSDLSVRQVLVLMT